MSSSALVRCDASPTLGGGHVMRCLALAQALARAGCEVRFSCAVGSADVVPALARSGFEVMELFDPLDPAELLGRLKAPADLIVFDQYGLDIGYERALRPRARKILVIDDLADRPHDCDVLVDTGSVSADAYRGLVPAHCRVLSGSAYAIIHPAFLSRRSEALARRDGREARRVLVSFGLVDGPNATMGALKALRAAGFQGGVDVVLGRAAPHFEEVRAAPGAMMHADLESADMAALMTAADIAVGAGGQTGWERCCLGLPTVLVAIADNQRGIVSQIAVAGGGLDVPAGRTDAMETALRALLDDGRARTAMASAAAALVDGDGASRIAGAVA